MIILELIILIVTLAIGTAISARNVNRNFQPPFRSHVELFLVGVPAGFMFALLVLPQQIEAVALAVLIGILAGVGYSFSLPRQWRYTQASKNKPNRP